MAGKNYKISLSFDVKGLSIFKEIAKESKEIKKAFGFETQSKESLAVLSDINNEVKQISSSLKSLEKTVSLIGKSFESLQKSVQNFSLKGVIDAFSNGLEQLVSESERAGAKASNGFLERFLANIDGKFLPIATAKIGTLSLVFSGLFAGLGLGGSSFSGIFKSLDSFGGGVLKFFKALIGNVANLFVGEISAIKTVFGGIFGFLTSGFVEIGELAHQEFLGNITRSEQGLRSILPAVKAVSASILVLVGGGQLLTSVFLGFRELIVGLPSLFSRLKPFGTARGPLQNITETVQTIATSFELVNQTALQTRKTFLLTFSAIASSVFLGPLTAIATSFSAINSLAGDLGRRFTRIKLVGLSALGSSRAQLGLIFFDLRKILQEALPPLLKLSEKFGKVLSKKEVQQALFTALELIKDISKVFNKFAPQIKKFIQGFSFKFNSTLNKVQKKKTEVFSTKDIKRATKSAKEINRAFEKLSSTIEKTDKRSISLKKAISSPFKDVLVEINQFRIKFIQSFKDSKKEIRENIRSIMDFSISIKDLVKQKGINQISQSFQDLKGFSEKVTQSFKDSKTEISENIRTIKDFSRSVFEASKAISPKLFKDFGESTREAFLKIKNISSPVFKFLKQQAIDFGKTFKQQIFDISTNIGKSLIGGIKGFFSFSFNALKNLFSRRQITTEKPSKASEKAVDVSKNINKEKEKSLSLEVEELKIQKINLELQKRQKEEAEKQKKKAKDLLVTAISYSRVAKEIKDRSENLTKGLEKAKEPVTGIRREFKATLKNLTLLKEIGDKPFKGFVGAGTGIGGQIRAIIDNLRFFRKEGSKTDVSKLSRGLDDLSRAFESVFKQVGSDKVGKFSNFSKEASKFFEDIRKDPKRLKQFEKDFQNFTASIGDTAKRLNVTGKGVGEKFTKLLTKGFEDPKSRAEVQKVINQYVELIAQFFPRSPAKVGPLKDATKFGLKTANFISMGIRKGKGEVTKSTGILAEAISRFFPRSLPLIGPLIQLPLMGAKIPFYIAKGMIDGIGSVVSSAKNIAVSIFDTLKNATNESAQTFRLSERLGIDVKVFSSLDSAIKTVGASSSDIIFAFQSFQRVLSDTATKEDLKRFKELGFNIDKARRSQEPFLELLFQTADGIKKAKDEGKDFGEILEATGLNLNSNFTNALLNGRKGLKDLQKEAVESGAFITKEAGELSIEFLKLSSQFESVVVGFKNSILVEILPIVNKTAKDIFQIFKENQVVVTSVVRNLGFLFAKAIESAVKFTKFILVEPKKATNIALKVIDSFFKLSFKSIEVGFGIFQRAIPRFFDRILPLILAGIGTLFIKAVQFTFETIQRTVVLLGDAIVAPIKAIVKRVETAFSEALSDTFIALNNIARKIPKAQSVFSFLGIKLLSDQDIANLNQEKRRLKKEQKDVSGLLDDLFTGFQKATLNSAKKELPAFFKGLVTEEDKQELKTSFQSVTKEITDAFAEIDSKVITNEDIKKRISEIGETLKDGFGKALEFIADDKTREKIVSGLGIVKEKFIGTFNDIKNSTATKGLFGALSDRFQIIKSEVQEAKDSALKAIDETATKTEKKSKEIAKNIKENIVIPLISLGTAKVGKDIADNIEKTKEKLKPLEDLISKLKENDPFLALKISLEALGNATESEAIEIKDTVLDAFKKLAEEDPFLAVTQSLRILKQESGGLKERIVAEAFGDITSSENFQKTGTFEERQGLLSEGQSATSEENFDQIEGGINAGFEEKLEKNPFGALIDSFEDFVTLSGEQGKKAGEQFTQAFISSAQLASKAIGSIGDIIGAVFELTGKKSKGLFIAQKALAIAQATINIAEGVTKAYAQGGVAGLITGISVATAGAVQIAKIASQEPPEFRFGGDVASGLVNGPSHENGGIPAITRSGKPLILEGDEFIISGKAKRALGQNFLEMINNLELPRVDNNQSETPGFINISDNATQFQDGGGIGIDGDFGGFTAESRDKTPIVLRITNIPDSESAIDRYFSSGRGEEQILNAMGNRASQARQNLGIGR